MARKKNILRIKFTILRKRKTRSRQQFCITEHNILKILELEGTLALLWINIFTLQIHEVWTVVKLAKEQPAIQQHRDSLLICCQFKNQASELICISKVKYKEASTEVEQDSSLSRRQMIWNLNFGIDCCCFCLPNFLVLGWVPQLIRLPNRGAPNR